MIMNVYWSSCKVPLFLSDINETLSFLAYFQKNINIPNFNQISSVGAEMFHADRQA